MLLYNNFFFVKFMLSICFLLNDVLLHGALNETVSCQFLLNDLK